MSTYVYKLNSTNLKKLFYSEEYVVDNNSASHRQPQLIKSLDTQIQSHSK